MVDTERSPAAERGPGVLYWKTTRERERERKHTRERLVVGQSLPIILRVSGLVVVAVVVVIYQLADRGDQRMSNQTAS